MSVPALRQPKKQTEDANNNIEYKKIQKDYVIITLDNTKKLVVSADSYNGIISTGDMYKCVFCDVSMELKNNLKEKHVKMAAHKKIMELYPHVSDFSENLVRKLSKETSYCTICNVTISNNQITRHVTTATHTEELERALLRASNYKPCQ